MKTMKWLVRREFWEHKGMFFWAPIIAAGLIVLAVLAATFIAVTLVPVLCTLLLGGKFHSEDDNPVMRSWGEPPPMRV